MDFRFEDTHFERLTESERDTERAYDKTIARKLLRRINLIRFATTSQDLFEGAGRFHELKGDRKGVFAFDLSGKERLIIRFENGRNTVVIVGVEDYH